MQVVLSGPRALAQPGPQSEILFPTVHLGKASNTGASVDEYASPTPYKATACNPEGLLSPLCALLGRVEGPKAPMTEKHGEEGLYPACEEELWVSLAPGDAQGKVGWQGGRQSECGAG